MFQKIPRRVADSPLASSPIRRNDGMSVEPAALALFCCALLPGAIACSDGGAAVAGHGGATSGAGSDAAGMSAAGPLEPLTAGATASEAGAGNPSSASGGTPSGGETSSDDVAGAPSSGEGGANPGASQGGGNAGADEAAGAAGEAATPTDEPAPELPAGVLKLSPQPGASAACLDPALMMRFEDRVRLATRGRFLLYEEGQATPAASVDLSQDNVLVNVGGSELRVPLPVFVADSGADYRTGTEGDAVFVTFASTLTPGRSYRVELEGTPIINSAGDAPVPAESLSWTFTTQTSAPSGSQLAVGYEPGADYCTLQAAIDAASNNTTLDIGEGVYHGLLRMNDKQGIVLRGSDRNRTRLVGINNENLNGGTRSRPLVLVQSASDLTIERMTIANLTPQGGSQAEALALMDCERCVVRNATIESLQDTLLWEGRIYAEDCLIVGNVDYIWGRGAAYFSQCEMRTVGRKGYNLQARNAVGAAGYVFVDSKLTADPGINGDVLARIDVSAYPGSQVAYVDCEMGSHIDPSGWLVTGGGSTNQLRFWEYQSRTPQGALVDVSRRLPGSRQLSDQEAAQLRDPANVLGGWTPPTGGQ